MTDRPGESSMQATHRVRLEQIRNEAMDITGAAVQISQMMTQVLEQGGAVNIQRQISAITSGYARMSKDWGVAEYLQGQGVTQKRPNK